MVGVGDGPTAGVGSAVGVTVGRGVGGKVAVGAEVEETVDAAPGVVAADVSAVGPTMGTSTADCAAGAEAGS